MDNNQYRPMCYKCLRPAKACFCKEIIPFNTTFKFCILMHPKEAKSGHIGTGRIANIALKDCNIIIDKDFDENSQVQKLIHSKEYFPMLLYPGEDALNISKETFPENYFQNKKPLVFILDGTWPCAKSMIRDSKTLHNLPRISFDSCITSKFAIKHQPAKYCLSTIESIYQVLFNLERLKFESCGNKKNILLESLQKLVKFQKQCANDPAMTNSYRNHGPYKDPSKRLLAKKWQKRNILF